MMNARSPVVLIWLPIVGGFVVLLLGERNIAAGVGCAGRDHR
jgi:hypothetical protein